MIVAPGVGSGLDINSIVSQLLAIERRPLDSLNQRESGLQAQLSDLGRLKGALSSFQSAMSQLSDSAKFNVFNASTSDEDAVTASADQTAAMGNTTIEVTQLAAAHKVASDAYTDSESVPETKSGVEMSIQVGADVNDSITLAISDLTLAEIRDAINSDADNPGVTATIINDNDGSRLVLTSDETGTSKALSIDFTRDGHNHNDPLDLTDVYAAADAELTVDGFDVTRASNEITDVIEGVTLSLHQVTAGPVQLSITRDDEKILESVQDFADEFNNLRGLVDELRLGSLASDSTLLSIERSLFGVLNSSAAGAGSYSYLSEIGVAMQKDGTMAVDTSQVTSAMNEDFNSFSALFSADGSGFASRFDTLAQNLLSSDDGLIETRSDGISTRLDALDGQRDRLERRFDATEQRLRNEFAALDTLLGQLQNTSAFLDQQLAILGRPGG